MIINQPNKLTSVKYKNACVIGLKKERKCKSASKRNPSQVYKVDQIYIKRIVIKKYYSLL